MKTVKGKFNEAIVYTDVVEDMALQQIKQLCDMNSRRTPESGLCRMSTPAPAVRSVRP